MRAPPCEDGGDGGISNLRDAHPPAPLENVLGNAYFARACGLCARGGWAEVEAAATLCTPARAAPERVQGVRGELHHRGLGNQEARRTRLAFYVKAGDAGAVVRLMDEGGEAAWAGWAELLPAAAGGCPPRARAWRLELFSHVAACGAAARMAPRGPRRGGDGAAGAGA